MITRSHACAFALIATAVLLAIAAGAPGVAFAESEADSPQSAVLQIGIPSDIDTMNPFTAYNTISNECLRISYDFLTTWDANNELIPDLAVEWSTDDAGKTWTFKLRQDVTWHDGRPMTAKDVAFTYNFIVQNDLSTYRSLIAAVEEAEATDDYTVVIRCSESTNSVLNGLVPILPEHVWSKVPEKEITTTRNVPVIGTGPFQVVEAKKGQVVRLEANKEYFRGAPVLDEIHWLIYQTVDGMVQDYLSGTIDAMVDLLPNYYESIKDEPGTKAYAGQAITFHNLGINCWDSPESGGNRLLLDPAIRQAIHLSIDKETLVERVLLGHGAPGAAILPPAAPFHWEPAAEQRLDYDPTKAQQLLDDSGYTDRDGDGVREDADGNELSFSLFALNEYPENVQAVKLIHEWLRDVGIDTQVKAESEAAFTDRVYADVDYDLYTWFWNGRPDPSFLLQIFTTDQIQNWSDSMYSNSEYDQLFEDQMSAVDEEERASIVDRLQEIVYEDSPYIIMWNMAKLQAIREDRFTGWQLVPEDGGVPLLSRNKFNYLAVTPVAAAEGAETSSNTVWVIAVVAVVVALLAVAIILFRRRERRVEE